MDLKYIKLYAPALLPFFLGNYFFMQASDGLNIHMFMPTWGVLSVIAFCLFLKRIVERTKDEEAKGVVLAVAILLYASSSMSGVMCMRKLWKGYTTMWTQAEEHVAEWIVRNTNKSDVFLSLEEVFEPVSLLAGRTLFVHSARTLWHLSYNWYLYRDELARIRAEPNSQLVPVIQYALENARKEGFDKRLKKPEMSQSWGLCFAYESYQLYNRRRGAQSDVDAY
jgi:hypothetical protein